MVPGWQVTATDTMMDLYMDPIGYARVEEYPMPAPGSSPDAACFGAFMAWTGAPTTSMQAQPEDEPKADDDLADHRYPSVTDHDLLNDRVVPRLLPPVALPQPPLPTTSCCFPIVINTDLNLLPEVTAVDPSSMMEAAMQVAQGAPRLGKYRPGAVAPLASAYSEDAMVNELPQKEALEQYLRDRLGSSLGFVGVDIISEQSMIVLLTTRLHHMRNNMDLKLLHYDLTNHFGIHREFSIFFEDARPMRAKGKGKGGRARRR